MTSTDATTARPRVTAVVVMYDSAADAARVVETCLAQHDVDLDVVVVDNGSNDDSAEQIDTRFGSEPRVTLVRMEHNRGFSGGANTGMAAALDRGADYVWLLTDDLELDADAARELVSAMEAHPEAGAAGQYIYHRDEPDRIYFGGGVVTEDGSTHERMDERDGASNDGTPQAVRETGFVTGASMFFRAGVLREVGLMDETYWLYWEDVDLSYRVKEGGHTLIVVPASKAWHHVTPALDRSMRTRQRYFWRNFLRFQVKHGLATKVAAAWAMAKRVPDTRRREGRSAALTQARSILDFLLGRSGPIKGRW